MKREKCIVCNSEIHPDSVQIGSQYPSAIFAEKNENYTDFIKSSSLNIGKCSNKECGLVQLSNEYNLDEVFNNYPYVSGTTATTRMRRN